MHVKQGVLLNSIAISLRLSPLLLTPLLLSFLSFLFSAYAYSDPALKVDPAPKIAAAKLEKKLVEFNLSAQSLNRGLIEFGLQADVNIIVAESLVSEYEVTAVLGRYRLKRALEIFLSKTPLVFRIVDQSNAVIIESPPVSEDLYDENLFLPAAGHSDDVEDVLVVSARRRDELPQDVPISLTLVSGEELDRRGVQDLAQLGASLINTTLKTARGTNSTLVAYIRGIGQIDPVAGFEPGVGIYIDDVYLNRPQGAVLDLYDVERIEVLRGPQGTLYGRNTIGGAIKYVTKRLGAEPALSVKGALGSYNQKDLVVSLSTPMAADTIRLGGSIAAFYRDGFGENVETGEEHYNKQILAARASVEITPSEALFIRLTADYLDDKSNPRPGYRQIPSVDERDERGEIYQPLDNVFDTRAGASASGHPISENTQIALGSALSIEYSVSDELIFRSISAYRQDRQESPIDFDGLPGNSFDTFVVYENNQTSQEFQFLYERENIQSLLGIYYLDARAFNAFDVVLGTIAGGSTSFTIGDVETKTWALFFDASIDVGDTMGVSLGARYTSDKRVAEVVKNFHEETLVSPYFADGSRDFSDFATDFRGERTDTGFTPRLSFSWQPSEELHLYASYSRGFKGGGFDPRGSYVTIEQGQGFAPETVDAFELGMKTDMMDGLARSSLALFYSDYSDVQIPGYIRIDTNGDGKTDDFAGSTSNAGDVTIIGLEFELRANLTDAFKADITLGILQTEYTEFLALVSNVENRESTPNDLADERVVPNAPEITLGLAFSYDFSLSSGELSVISSANYTSLTHQDVIPNEDFDQPGYTLFNASMVWDSSDEHWRLGLHGLNLSDKEYITGIYSFQLAENSSSLFYGNPRTFSASIKYSF